MDHNFSRQGPHVLPLEHPARRQAAERSAAALGLRRRTGADRAAALRQRDGKLDALPQPHHVQRSALRLYPLPDEFDILNKENLNKQYGVKNAPGDTFGDGLDHGLARFSPTPRQHVSIGYNEIGSRSFWPNRNFLDNLQFNDNLLIQRGAHSLKTGVEFRRADIFREAQRVPPRPVRLQQGLHVGEAQRRRQPYGHGQRPGRHAAGVGERRPPWATSSARTPSRPTGAPTSRTTGKSRPS